MLLTSGYAFRGFAEQKSFSFTSDMSISNTSGNSNIAISGDGGIFNLMYSSTPLIGKDIKYQYDYNKYNEPPM